MEWLTAWGPPGAGIGVVLLLLRYPQIIEKIFGSSKNGNGYVKKEECHVAQESIKEVVKEGFTALREDVRHLTKRVDGLYDK